MSKNKTIIIGAGPAGLSCGYQLTKLGHKVSVFEVDNSVGGMAKSFNLWGQRVDLGPHRFFSKLATVNRFFNDLIKEESVLVNRQTRIFYRNRFFDYPIKLGNVLKNLPLRVIIQILWYFIIQQFNQEKKAENFEDWVTMKFGKKLYDIFFKNYTEKLWGIKCTDIDADWAAQRIKTLTLYSTIKSALFGDRNNKHKTLVDQFYYPKNGAGSLYEKAAESILENGGEIQLQTPVKRVILNDANTQVIGVEFMNGKVECTNNVVSTMPLTKLICGFKNVPTQVTKAVEQLYFRNTILVYLEIDKEDLFSDNWLYIHSPDVSHGRITNFSNWRSPINSKIKKTILCLEIWCFEKDKIWRSPDIDIANKAKEELGKINLLPKNANILNSKIVKIPKCYPVYETGYKKNLDIIINYLNEIKGLYPIGRYGSFKYNNQDHSILMGLLTADKINGDTSTDLWQINTDSEYQEKSVIENLVHQ